MFKKGFTLAEVLITLGIIGVVAAITLPTLIQNNKNRELQSQFKKSYSTLSQIVQRVVTEEYGGIAPTPATNDIRVFLDNMAKYAANSKVCYASCDTNIFPFPDRDCHTLEKFYSNISTTALIDDGVIALNDGSTIFIDNGTIKGDYSFTIDVNGAWKQPNSGGIDVFSFQLLPSGKLISIGDKKDCLTNPNNYCGAAALSDPDYFKKVKKK